MLGFYELNVGIPDGIKIPLKKGFPQRIAFRNFIKTFIDMKSAFIFLCIIVLLASCGKTGSPTSPNTGTGNGSGPTHTATTPIAPPVISQVSPQQGPAGTSVTITGTGFSDTTANDTVYFNGKIATISAASATQLVVTVPLLAGTGPVGLRVHGDSVTGPAFTYQYQYVVTTLAGNGAQGNVDGTGTAASFNYPVGIAADASGNLYVGDQFNEKVRKITPAGVVTSLSATFYYPTGVAIDASGNVYVTNLGGNTIREVTPAGVVTTVAGTGVTGSLNGPAASATFSEPSGVAVDGSGNLYITDASNNKIREVSSGGTVSTFAGSGTIGSADGTGTAASFYYPYGIAIDGSDNLYIADSRNNAIRKITSGGVVSTFATGFNYPTGIAIDSSGNLYVADEGNNEIRMITPSGVVTTIAGSTTPGDIDGTGSAAAFEYPYGIAIDRSGNIYVTDQGNDKVRKITIQ
jgi:serine/threonine-protein kinase